MGEEHMKKGSISYILNRRNIVFTPTLVNVCVNLLVFTRIAGTSYTGMVDIGFNTI